MSGLKGGIDVLGGCVLRMKEVNGDRVLKRSG